MTGARRLAALCLALICLARLAAAQASPPPRDGVHDFDFLHGTWRIHDWRLRDPLTGSSEWYEFERKSGVFLVRFYWTSSGPDAARWKQAFSADGGRTWETNWMMQFTRGGEAAALGGAQPAAAPTRTPPCCAVVELRRYALHPGSRETLIDVFDREFVEGQEAVGMEIIGQFRDVDHPDVFTWLRGFPDMPSRERMLRAFYDGPVWAAHREVANRTMVSSDDVRLLRPARPGAGFVLDAGRPAPGATAIPPGLVVATIYTLDAAAAAEFPDFFHRSLAPLLAASGAPPLAVFETETAPNTFQRLPVREGDHAFVWFARFTDVAAYERTLAALAADRRWSGTVRPALERMLRVPAEVWRLTPTARSRIPG